MADEAEDVWCYKCECCHDQLQDSWWQCFKSRYIRFLLFSQDALDSDLAIMGVPCPVFSKLNKNTKRELYNPFVECLAGIPQMG